MNLSRTLVLAGAAVLALSGIPGIAQATSPPSTTCSGGRINSGTYDHLRVTGACSVPEGADVTIMHGLTITRGSSFSADTKPSEVHIGGDVVARRGSTFALGCTPAHGCEGGDSFSVADIGGDVRLDHVYNAAINGVSIGGSVISAGGGAGFVFDKGQFVPFSIKDDFIHGDLRVWRLKTTWFGVIRSTINGTVALRRIKNDDPDGVEVVHNTIGQDLICFRNHPKPQFGDADDGAPPGYPYSTVGGHVYGQCKFVLAP